MLINLRMQRADKPTGSYTRQWTIMISLTSAVLASVNLCRGDKDATLIVRQQMRSSSATRDLDIKISAAAE